MASTPASANASNGHTTCPKTRVFYLNQPPLVEDLFQVCNRSTSKELYPLSADVQKDIPLYDISRYTGQHNNAELVNQLQDEWNHILSQGPGVVVLKNMFKIDDYEQFLTTSSSVFHQIVHEEALEREKEKDDLSGNKLDNSIKVFNTFTKLAVKDPKTFIGYYSNPWLTFIGESWLGPGYRINSTLNVVPPGGTPQPAHRDFHMGFFASEKCVEFPRLMQVANQVLTLQGAVAHGDMPISSGPTRFLPFSQLFQPGYMAHRRPEFQKYFQENYVSLPLEKGDGVFFNPSILHAAGSNTTTDHYRAAQLIQLNSIFGKPSEWINSIPIIESCWDLLQAKYKQEGLSKQIISVVKSIGDGHQFPATLDRIVAKGDIFSMKTEQDLIIAGLEAGWCRDKVVEELKKSQQNKMSAFF